MTTGETFKLNEYSSIYRAGSFFGVNEDQLRIFVGYRQNPYAESIDEQKTPVQKIIPLKNLEGLLKGKKASTDYFTAFLEKGELQIKFSDGFFASFNPRDYSVLKREIDAYRMKQIF
jgi:hypothetical protein